MFKKAFEAFSKLSCSPYIEAEILSTTAPLLDAGGSIAQAGTAIRRPCRCQVDSASFTMRQSDGFVDGDVRLLIIGLDGELTADDRALVNGVTYLIRSVQTDPSGIGFDCAARIQ